jgi:hypothetical protein
MLERKFGEAVLHNHVSWHQLMPLSYFTVMLLQQSQHFKGADWRSCLFLKTTWQSSFSNLLLAKGSSMGGHKILCVIYTDPLDLNFGCNMVNYYSRPGKFCTVSGYSHHQTPLMQARATPSQASSSYLDKLAVVDLVHSLYSEGGCLESLIITEHTSIDSKSQ